jgi:2-methylisocitrate lyase-like PEP mutase family enzyme
MSADIESGFGATPAEVAETIAGVIAAGAVGINIEDKHVAGSDSVLRPTEEQAERIAAARAAADTAELPLYINARIDTYLFAVGDPATRLQETLARAAAYLAAGADGIFVPGVADPVLIAALTEVVTAPLNILAGPGSPSVPELGKLGVARVSLGSSVAAAAYAVVRRAARELADTGTYTALADELAYGDINHLMA